MKKLIKINVRDKEYTVFIGNLMYVSKMFSFILNGGNYIFFEKATDNIYVNVNETIVLNNDKEIKLAIDTLFSQNPLY